MSSLGFLCPPGHRIFSFPGERSLANNLLEKRALYMNPHLTDYNEWERTDYMMVVASMAGVDGKITSEEVYALRELCKAFVLGPEARGQVMAAATTPPDELEDILKRLAGSGLKHSLLVDLAAMAYRDNVLTASEKHEYDRLGHLMEVPEEQSQAILKFAEGLFVPGTTPEKITESLNVLEKKGVTHSAMGMSATLMALGLTGPVEARL